MMKVAAIHKEAEDWRAMMKLNVEKTFLKQQETPAKCNFWIYLISNLQIKFSRFF